MPDITVTLLGRFAVTIGGAPVAEASWNRRHAAAVVKVLALAPGRRLHWEQVIDRVWPQDTIAEAVPKLRQRDVDAARARRDDPRPVGTRRRAGLAAQGALKKTLRRVHACKPESLRPRRPDIP